MNDYWNTIYQTKPAHTVSWYEHYPHHSVRMILSAELPLDARIIDVGGGDSRLVDALLALGFQNVTVLDLSQHALDRAKARLGHRADEVNWLVEDITAFTPPVPFDFWHDRAAFHFLTTPDLVARYLHVAQAGIRKGGVLTVGTFAEDGPTRCSGLPVRQYSPKTLTGQFAPYFTRQQCDAVDHQTPSGVVQAFTFCQFTRH